MFLLSLSLLITLLILGAAHATLNMDRKRSTSLLARAKASSADGCQVVGSSADSDANKVDLDHSDATSSELLSTENVLALQGGDNDQDDKKQKSLKRLFWKRTVALWGILQVVSIMANAVKRLLPIAIQPFEQNDLQPYQWAMYAGWVLYMAYIEGYQAFQMKFSPLIVKRAFSLDSQAPSILNYIFAGPFAMGMFNATKKRKIITWSITIGVFALVKIVKKLPYPYRSIIDGGVVVGLSYGTLSIIWQTIRGLCGHTPQVDGCFPAESPTKAKSF